MLQFTDLSKHLGAKELFTNINLRFNRSHRIGVVVKIGIGRSTFFKLTPDEESLDEERILFIKGNTRAIYK